MVSLPNSLQVLVDRFDSSAFDASQKRARIRLIIPVVRDDFVRRPLDPQLRPHDTPLDEAAQYGGNNDGVRGLGLGPRVN